MKTYHERFAAQLAAVLCLLWLPAAAEVLNDRCDRQGRPLVIPAPKEYRLTGGAAFRLAGGAALDDRSGNRAGSAVKVLRQLFPAPGAGTVELRYDETVRNPEGFRVSVEGDRIVLRASGGGGFYYAARTVADLVRNSATAIPALEIRDEPALAVRGLAFSCRELSRDKIPAFKRLVSALGSLRYNCLVLEFADNFPYRDNPFTERRFTLTEPELREIVEHIRDQEIKIVPQLQIQSHVRWLSTHPDFESFLEAPASRLWISSYCPNNPKARELVFRCLREQLEFFDPEFFDVCFDEVTTCVFRQCDKCRAYSPDDLLYKHLKEVCDIVFAHGSTPQFAHDMFIPGWHEKVLERMDKRCRISYWRYSATPLDLFSYFSGKGFTVCGMPLLGYMDNVAWMAKLAQKYRTGVIPTFWHHFDRTLHDPRPSSPECYGALVAAAETAWNPDLDREMLPYDPVYEMRRRLYVGTPHRAAYEMGQLGDFRPDPALLTVTGATEDPVAEWRRDGLIATPVPLGRVVNAEFGEIADFPRFSAPEHLKRLADEFAAAPERFHLTTSGNFYYGVAVAGSANDRVLPDKRTIPVERRAAGFSFMLTAARPENTNHFVPYAKHGVKKKLRAGTLTLRYADGTGARASALLPLQPQRLGVGVRRHRHAPRQPGRRRLRTSLQLRRLRRREPLPGKGDPLFGAFRRPLRGDRPRAAGGDAVAEHPREIRSRAGVHAGAHRAPGRAGDSGRGLPALRRVQTARDARDKTHPPRPEPPRRGRDRARRTRRKDLARHRPARAARRRKEPHHGRTPARERPRRGAVGLLRIQGGPARAVPVLRSLSHGA